RLAESSPAAHACVMDAEALAFAPDSFDIVAASFVIHLLDDPAAGVAEAYRVLRSGGRVALTGASACSRAVREEGETRSPSLAASLDALFAEFAARVPPGAGMGRPVDAADLLVNAGFRQVNEDRVAADVRFPDAESVWRWVMSHGYRAFVE